MLLGTIDRVITGMDERGPPWSASRPSPLRMGVRSRAGLYGRLTREQGEQISRLTIFSVIFLPLTALTGFFGMNFGWMATALGGLPSFTILGVLLPVASVVATVVWLRRRDLL